MKKINLEIIKEIIDDLKVRDAYNSTHIEGNTLSMSETLAILIDKRIPVVDAHKKTTEFLEVNNYNNSWDFAIEFLENSYEININSILEIHNNLMIGIRKDAGYFRNVNVYVTGSSVIPPIHEIVQSEMKKIIKKNNFDMLVDENDLLCNIAKFHIEFEATHPFSDGNGRTGRMIMNLQLMKNNYLPAIIPFKEREKYINFIQDGVKSYKKGWKDDSIIYEFSTWIKDLILESEKRYESIIDKFGTKNLNR